jgi:hypothetical protein
LKLELKKHTSGAKEAAEKGSCGSARLAGAKQAAEKLNFTERAKNGSRQDARGTIRELWVMVFYPPICTHSARISSFSAACKARY